jgi:hypothetical protein
MNTVLHFTKASLTQIDQGAANSIGQTVKTQFTSSNLAAAIHTTIALANVALRDVSAANLAEFLDANPAVPGSNATVELLPSRTAICVTHRTARAGRSFRGRSFLGGFTVTGANDAGHAGTAETNAAVAFLTGIRTSLASQLIFVVAHPDTYDAAGNVSVPGFSTPVTASLSRNANFETQRRRNF